MIAQSTFFMDDEHGRARVFQQWGDDEETIQIAIETCPVDCIHYVPYDELVSLEVERRDQNINFKARLVSQAENGNALSHRVGGANTFTASSYHSCPGTYCGPDCSVGLKQNKSGCSCSCWHQGGNRKVAHWIEVTGNYNCEFICYIVHSVCIKHLEIMSLATWNSETSIGCQNSQEQHNDYMDIILLSMTLVNIFRLTSASCTTLLQWEHLEDTKNRNLISLHPSTK